jgi:hypothetical protein
VSHDDPRHHSGGLLTKPHPPGRTAPRLEPFPTLLVSISHIVVDAISSGESQVTAPEGVLGTDSLSSDIQPWPIWQRISC